jgi:hypothetical protein
MRSIPQATIYKHGDTLLCIVCAKESKAIAKVYDVVNEITLTSRQIRRRYVHDGCCDSCGKAFTD